jgi:hypothetical protein
MKKRTTLGITMTAAALICVTGLVFAQGPWQGSTASADSALPSEYQFTQDQIEELENIRSKYADKLLKVEKELAAKQVELESTWSQPDIATSKVYDIQRQVLELESRAEDLRLAANAEAADLLSPQQRYYVGDVFTMGSYGWSCPWDDASWGAGSRGWVERSGVRRLARGCGCGSCW